MAGDGKVVRTTPNRGLAAAALTAALAASPVSAGPAGDLLRDNLYGGTLSAGLTALQPMVDAGDQEAKFGVGVLTFFTGVEGLLQALYRYGLSAPETGPLGEPLGVPLPSNPSPEPLDYETFRGVLAEFVAKLDESRTILMEAGESGDYVVLLDPLRFRADINGDGLAEDSESIGAVVGVARGAGATITMDMMTPTEPAATGKDKSDKVAETKPEVLEEEQSSEAQVPPVEAGIGFDRADAIWLAGYSDVVAAQADLLLAHDFTEFFDAVFHRFFPRAGLPMEDYATGGMLMMDPETDTAIADLVAAIHTFNWQVIEPERFSGLLERARRVTAASRLNWDAILAETDDRFELIPSPAQTPTVQGEEGRITEDMVAAWRDTLDKVDQIIAGELLIPHWRFQQGFDLKAFFESSRRTDLVMLLTGYGALPYLKEGPIADAETFALANGVFGENLLGYAFWFN
jgi:hypothetical protein